MSLAAVTPEEVDRLLGAVAQTSDDSFNTIVELGFADSIRREWAWRRSRGESTANLAAFTHLDPGPDRLRTPGSAGDASPAESGFSQAGRADTRSKPDITRVPLMSATLILLRHGESEWNAKNLFTGWVDVDLNAKGEAEAQRGGELLVENDLLPDVLHTSLLKRAIRTSQIALQVADRHWIPTKRHWRLNERHYGALQGKDKAATLAEYGEEQFMVWRRSYDTPPPPIDNADEFANFHDPRTPRCRRSCGRRPSASRTCWSGRCLLVRRDRPGPRRRQDGAGRRPRQLAAAIVKDSTRWGTPRSWA